MSISAAKCTSSGHKLGYHYHSTKSSSVPGCNGSITLWNRVCTCDVTVNKVSYVLTLFKWVCVFLKDLDVGFIKKHNLSKHSGKRLRGQKLSSNTPLPHSYNPSLDHREDGRQGANGLTRWGMRVYHVSTWESPLTCQVHVKKSLSKVSLEMLCQAALGTWEDGKEKKEKEGQKEQQGYVWHSRKCTWSCFRATDQPICEYLLLSVCFVYEEDIGHPAKT